MPVTEPDDPFDGVTRLWPQRAGVAFPLLAEVEAYWEGLRPAGALPLRPRIDPRGLERALAHAFMLEHLGGGNGRLRIAGSHLAALAGGELRGRALAALFAGPAHDMLAAALLDAFAGPACLRLGLEAPEAVGAPRLAGALVLLPLAEPDGQITRALGCLETHGPIGRAPRLFEIAGVQHRAVADGRKAAALRPPPQPLGAPGLSEPAARFQPPARRRAPHLRVVVPAPERAADRGKD